MISIEAFSELLAKLHAASLESENWQGLFDLLCMHTQTATGLLLVNLRSNDGARILVGGGLNFDPESQRQYNDHFSTCDPYLAPLNRNSRVGVINADELLPREKLKKSEFFNDCLAHFDLHYASVLAVGSPTSRIASVSLWRSAQQGAMTKESEILLGALVPHLQSTFAVMEGLRIAGEHALRAEAALDAAPAAAFLLREDGSLVHMNKAAEDLARGQDGIRIQRNRLVASDVSRQARLQALISFAAAASGAAPAQPGGAVSLPRIANDRPLNALVVPLRLANQGRSSPAHVLVLITDPNVPAQLSREILSVLYGLTSSEVEVANALLSGLSIAQIADARQVSSGTARTQVKSVLSKTGTRRQSELIRLLLSLPKTHSTGG